MLFVFCFNVSAGFNRPKYSCYFNTFITQKFSKSKFIWIEDSPKAGKSESQ